MANWPGRRPKPNHYPCLRSSRSRTGSSVSSIGSAEIRTRVANAALAVSMTGMGHWTAFTGSHGFDHRSALAWQCADRHADQGLLCLRGIHPWLVRHLHRRVAVAHRGQHVRIVHRRPRDQVNEIDLLLDNRCNSALKQHRKTVPTSAFFARRKSADVG